MLSILIEYRPIIVIIIAIVIIFLSLKDCHRCIDCKTGKQAYKAFIKEYNEKNDNHNGEIDNEILEQVYFTCPRGRKRVGFHSLACPLSFTTWFGNGETAEDEAKCLITRFLITIGIAILAFLMLYFFGAADTFTEIAYLDLAVVMYYWGWFVVSIAFQKTGSVLVRLAAFIIWIMGSAYYYIGGIIAICGILRFIILPKRQKRRDMINKSIDMRNVSE